MVRSISHLRLFFPCIEPVGRRQYRLYFSERRSKDANPLNLRGGSAPAKCSHINAACVKMGKFVILVRLASTEGHAGNFRLKSCFCPLKNRFHFSSAIHLYRNVGNVAVVEKLFTVGWRNAQMISCLDRVHLFGVTCSYDFFLVRFLS